MNIQWILNRIKGMITHPSREWETILAEDDQSNSITRKFVMPLIVLSTLTYFVGSFFSNGGYGVVSPLLTSLSHFVAVLAGYHFTSLLLVTFGSTFGSDVDRTKSYKLIAYSLTPYFVATIIVNLFPLDLVFLKILYFVTIYLIWLGADKLFQTPDNKKLGFVIIIVVLLFGIHQAIFGVLLEILPIEIVTVE